MVDTLKIKGKIIEKQKTIGGIAKKVPISALTMGRQISNKRPMTLKVAMVLMEELEIPKEEFTNFFCIKSCENATKHKGGEKDARR